MDDKQTDKNISVVLESNLTKVRYSPYPCRERRAPDRFVFPDNHRCTDDYDSSEYDSDPFGGDTSDDSSSSQSTRFTNTTSTSDGDSFCVDTSEDDESIITE
jgi:hypothetical protein